MPKTKITKNGVVERKLIGLADLVITAAQKAKDPTMAIPIRALSNGEERAAPVPSRNRMVEAD